jgi:hypothetical protein
MRLAPAIREELARHGIVPGPEDTPATLRERLNDVYVDEVRRLRDRRRQGQIPAREYAAHVEALRRRFPLLGIPPSAWAGP